MDMTSNEYAYAGEILSFEVQPDGDVAIMATVPSEGICSPVLIKASELAGMAEASKARREQAGPADHDHPEWEACTRRCPAYQDDPMHVVGHASHDRSVCGEWCQTGDQSLADLHDHEWWARCTTDCPAHPYTTRGRHARAVRA
jgi:hypothetical protein